MDNDGGRTTGGRARGRGARRRLARGGDGCGTNRAPYIDGPPSSGPSPPDSLLLDGNSPPGSTLPVGPIPSCQTDVPRPDSGMSTSTGLDPRRPRVAEIVQLVCSHVVRPLEAYLLLTDIISDPNSVRSFLKDYFLSIGGSGRRHPETEPFEVVFRRMCRLDPFEVDDALRRCSTVIEDVSTVVDNGFIEVLRSLELTITEVPLLFLMYELQRDAEFDMAVAANQIIALDLNIV